MAGELGNDEIRVQVGQDVQLSDETTLALENLAEALAAEGEDEVAGFSFQAFGTDELFMMGGGMGPKVGVVGEPGGMGPKVSVSGKCAIDIVVTVPVPKIP